jgi:PhnB protein
MFGASENNPLARPQDYHTVTPFLSIHNADKAIEFYKDVFGASVKMRMERPDGKIAHAQIHIGDSKIMLTEDCPDMPGPKSLGGSPVCIYVFVDHVDAIFELAKEKGADILQEPADQFYGDRTAMFTDPFGHVWCIATHVEDVTGKELENRAAQMFGAG